MIPDPHSFRKAATPLGGAARPPGAGSLQEPVQSGAWTWLRRGGAFLGGAGGGVTIPYFARIINPGVQVTGAKLLAHNYRVGLPTGFTSFVIQQVRSTLITASASGSFVADILLKRGANPFASIFKSGQTPTIPVGDTTSDGVEFAINTFFLEDLLQFSVLTADGTAAGLEIYLIGVYN